MRWTSDVTEVRVKRAGLVLCEILTGTDCAYALSPLRLGLVWFEEGAFGGSGGIRPHWL
jgi:hypothetical protein